MLDEEKDGLDYHAMLETFASAGWALILTELRRDFGQHMLALRKRGLEHGETEHIRGYIAGLEKVMMMPDQTRAMAKKDANSKPRKRK